MTDARFHSPFMPLRALIKRELLTTLRSPKPYVSMAVLVLLLTLGFSMIIYSNQAEDRRFSAQDSRFVFTNLVLGLYIAGALLIPPMAAISICVERQNRNLELLQLTFASPASITAAKICGIMGMYTLLLAATFPLFGTLFFFSGLDAAHGLISALVIYAGSLAATSVGVACSAWCRRTTSAILTAAAGVFTLQYGVLGVINLSTETFLEGTALDSWLSQRGDTVSGILSPLGALVGIADDRLNVLPFIASLAIQAVLALASWLAATLFLRRIFDTSTPKPIDASVNLDTRRRKLPSYLTDMRQPWSSIRDRQNPVYIAERLSGVTGRIHWRIWIAVAFGMPYLLLCAWYVFRMGVGIAAGAPLITPVMLCGIVLLCIAPAIIAPAMAREFELGNIDMLRTTLLRPRDIAAGKLLAALADLAPLVASMIVGSIPLLIAGYAPLANDVIAVAVVLPYSLALIAAAAWGARSTAASLIRGYGAILLAHAAIPFAVLVILDLVAPRDFSFPTDHSGTASFLSPLLTRIYVHDRSRYLQDSFELDLYLYWNMTIFAVLAIPIAYVAWYQIQRQFRGTNP